MSTRAVAPMATRENIKWLKTDLHTCGLNLDKLSELPASLSKLINVKLEVTKRTRGENPAALAPPSGQVRRIQAFTPEQGGD